MAFKFDIWLVQKGMSFETNQIKSTTITIKHLTYANACTFNSWLKTTLIKYLQSTLSLKWPLHACAAKRLVVSVLRKIWKISQKQPENGSTVIQNGSTYTINLLLKPCVRANYSVILAWGCGSTDWAEWGLYKNDRGPFEYS